MTEFADRMNRIKGSAVRELFKLVADPSIISFGGGNPARNSFPTEDIKRIADKVLTENSYAVLQYGGTEGYAPLKKAIIEKLLPEKGFTVEMDGLLITTGSTQAMDLIAKVFLNKGDTILVEAPTFLGAIQTYNAYEANIVPVPMDTEGVLTDDLEKLVKKHSPKLFYCIPTFQNPSGKTLGAERRKRIAELAKKYDFIVMEDDPYGDLRYEGEAQPTIKSFDTDNRVLYLGSFSKIVSPGLRVGYVAGESGIIRKLTLGKQGSDLHCSILSQAIVGEYLKEDLLPSHLVEINADYKTRRDAMLSAMDEFFPKACTYTRPEGGLFIWGEFHDKTVCAEQLFRRAVAEKKVAFVPGEHFFTDPENHRYTFRLNYSAETPDTIRDGIQRLGEVFRDAAR